MWDSIIVLTCTLQLKGRKKFNQKKILIITDLKKKKEKKKKPSISPSQNNNNKNALACTIFTT